MFSGKHKGRYHGGQLSVFLYLRHCQQSDLPSLCSGEFEICQRNPADPLCMNFSGFHCLSRSQCRKDRRLTASVMSFHIRLRIALRISQLLSLLQDLVIIRLLRLHSGKDVIGGAIQNACHCHDPLR